MINLSTVLSDLLSAIMWGVLLFFIVSFITMVVMYAMFVLGPSNYFVLSFIFSMLVGYNLAINYHQRTTLMDLPKRYFN